MSERPGFLASPDDEAEDARARYLVLQIRDRLEELSRIFLYKVSPREITAENLRGYEAELREICHQLDIYPALQRLFPSVDKILYVMHDIIKSLNIALDIMTMPRSVANQTRLYNIYTQIARNLSHAASVLRLPA